MKFNLLSILFLAILTTCLPLRSIGQNDSEAKSVIEVNADKAKYYKEQPDDNSMLTVLRCKRGRKIVTNNSIKIASTASENTFKIKSGNKLTSTSFILIDVNSIKIISSNITAKEIIIKCSTMKIRGNVVLRADRIQRKDKLTIEGRGHLMLAVGPEPLPFPIVLKGGGLSVSFINK